MRTSVQKWGNSLGIRIPKVVAEEAELRPGSVVELVRRGDEIVVRVVRRPAKRYRLDDLVRKIKPGNRHDEIIVDGPRGRELW